MPPPNQSHGSEVDTVTKAASPTPSSAAHRVFAIPELLCDIAARLSPKEIIVATGVCHTWRNAIAADLNIQQALFLKPREVREVIAEDFYILDLERPIPFQECAIIGDLNPWISDICGRVYECASVHTFVNFDFLSCGGLWREMFITQPPCKAAIVLIQLPLLIYYIQRIDFEREAGIKIGELYDFIAEETRNRPECRGTTVYLENFDTKEYACDLQFHIPTTRCQVRHGEACRPPQLPKLHSPQGSDYTQGHEPNDGDGVSQGVINYGGYESDSEEEYSDDDEDPDEFAAEQADEADQYFRW